MHTKKSTVDCTNASCFVLWDLLLSSFQHEQSVLRRFSVLLFSPLSEPAQYWKGALLIISKYITPQVTDLARFFWIPSVDGYQHRIARVIEPFLVEVQYRVPPLFQSSLHEQHSCGAPLSTRNEVCTTTLTV